jgi:heat shock protein beta
MERIILSQTHSKANDVSREYYLNQKKTFEINPRHPLVKELLRRVNDDPTDPVAKETALTLFRTATLRSGYMLKDTVDFAQTVESMMRQTLGVPMDEEIEDEDDAQDEEDSAQIPEEDAEGEDQGDDAIDTEHDEL